jgi:hypothetical protein
VDGGVEVELDPPGPDPSFRDADEVVEPAVALVVRLEPADEALASRLVAVEHRPPAKLEEDRRALGSGDQPTDVRQHAAVAPAPGVVRPDGAALDTTGGRSSALSPYPIPSAPS